MNEPGGICCYKELSYLLRDQSRPGLATQDTYRTCERGHTVCRTDNPSHRNDELATVETCAEFEKRHSDFCEKRNTQLHRIAVALDVVGPDECPSVDDVVQRIEVAIESLKLKAAKYDAMTKQLDEHPYKPERYDPASGIALPTLECAKCKVIYDGKCIGCGKKHGVTIATASGDLEIKVDTRPEMQLYGGAGYNLPVIVQIEQEPVVEHKFSIDIKYRDEDPQENGPGLRAQGGEYTEPGEVVIACDHGWDE